MAAHRLARAQPGQHRVRVGLQFRQGGRRADRKLHWTWALGTGHRLAELRAVAGLLDVELIVVM